jgi:LysR family transcriptional regulator of gallate degradation
MRTSLVSPFDLNLRHLRGFLAACAEGSISMAASVTGLSQPALTQALVKFERQLGVALFERSRWGVRPTPAAQTLVPRVEAALRHLTEGAHMMTGKPIVLDRRLGAHQLRAYLSLIENRSFTATAAVLQLSASSVQRLVRGIETILGKSLLDRRGRQLTINAEGRRFARSCRLAIHELEAAFSDLGLESDHVSIALGTTPLARALLAPEAMSRFRAESSHVGFQVLEGSWGELVELLRDGLIDLIVGELPDHPSANLVKMPLYRESVLVVSGRQHPLANKANPTERELASYPWIIGPETSLLRDEWERLFTSRRPSAPIQCESIMVMGRLLTSENLLSLATPDQVALQIRSGLLVQIGSPLGRLHTIGVTLREGWQLTAAQHQFVLKLGEVSREMNTRLPKAPNIGRDWV